MRYLVIAWGAHWLTNCLKRFHIITFNCHLIYFSLVESNKNLKLHKLSNENLTSELLKLGGIPPDLLDDQDFIDYYLPLVRRDLKLIENYKFNKNVNPLNIAFTVLSGTNDQSTSKSGVLGWKDLSLKSCEFNTINGNHFFVHNKIEDVMNIINKTLL